MNNADKEKLASELFARYFRENYPGPDTIINRPDWHSPKIFRAVLSSLQESGLNRCECWADMPWAPHCHDCAEKKKASSSITSNETAWLIERREPNPEYLYVVDWFDFHWTTDSLKAIRFARREDAEQMLRMTETEVCFAVEHEWGLLENEALPNCKRCQESKPTVFVPTGFSGEHELLCGACVGIMLGEAYDLMEKANNAALAMKNSGRCPFCSKEVMNKHLRSCKANAVNRGRR